MGKKIRFGEFSSKVSIRYKWLSYNSITSTPGSQKGIEAPFVRRAGKISLRKVDVYRLLAPYVSSRFIDQFKAVVPLAAYLILFQLLILHTTVADPWIITSGLLAVILGLMLFIEGLKQGLMPLGEMIGDILPAKLPLQTVVIITFMLGMGVTFAEPAIGALKAAGSTIVPERSPYLYAMLTDWADTLAMTVGIGVGLAAVVGMLRLIYGWSLKPLIYLTVIPALGLVFVFMDNPHLSAALGVAWDCGAVTTGPVTVPIVLSIGIGAAAATGKNSGAISGFGIVTLASLFPVIAVMALALYIVETTPVDAIIAGAAAKSMIQEPLWTELTPWNEIILGVRAVMPLSIFLLLVMRFVLKTNIRHGFIVAYGVCLAVIGMIIFNVGLSYGLSKLGAQSGGLIPAAFTEVNGVEGSPLYLYALGIIVAITFAWFLGFGATLAEPALNALGMTVENLTDGALKKKTLMYAVSLGVGSGIAIGALKIIYDIPLAYLLLPGYFIALVLTFFSSEEFVNIAWDSAGVTTGPVTVPLVLAMGIGFGNAISAKEGFGVLSMASVCPIISVLTTGLWIRLKIKLSHAKSKRSKQKHE